jgi:hypothetical protein
MRKSVAQSLPLSTLAVMTSTRRTTVKTPMNRNGSTRIFYQVHQAHRVEQLGDDEDQEHASTPNIPVSAMGRDSLPSITSTMVPTSVSGGDHQRYRSIELCAPLSTS